MMKKILAILLAVLLIATLAACGGGGDTDTAATPAPPAGGGETTADPPEASDEPILIGHFGPLTGPISASGQYAHLGVELAVALINEEGGLLGRPVELIVYDDAGTPEAAVRAAERLIEEDHVIGIIGSQLSGNVQAAGDRIEAAQIPIVATGVAPVITSNGWQYLFRALANSGGGAGPLVDAMVELGTTRLATIVFQDEGSMSSAEMILDAVANTNIEVTTEEIFQPGDTDWTGQFSRMIATDPDGILLQAQGEHIGPMMMQLRALGYTGYVFGPETMSLPDIRAVGGDAANGIVFFAPHVIPDAIEEAGTDLEREFLENFVRVHGQFPGSDVAYRAFDAMTILAEGIRRAGSTDGAAIADAIRNMSGLQLLAGVADFTQFDNGESMSGMQVFITHNGRNQLFSSFLADYPIDYYS